MIAALDAHYDEEASIGTAAAVVFEHWEDAAPSSEYAAKCSDGEPYVPGEFFRRELPCLLAVLKALREPLNSIIIDGYVNLGDKPGLGMHLWEALGKTTSVIGVAKTRFHGADAVEINRGRSQTPLYVTGVGIDPSQAAARIKMMHGPFRIPTLLNRVDRLARKRCREGNSAQQP